MDGRRWTTDDRRSNVSRPTFQYPNISISQYPTSMHVEAPRSNGVPFRFSEGALAEVRELTKRFPEGRHKSALLRTLHLAQEENKGWLSIAALDHVAEVLGLQPIEVYEV